MIFNRHQLLLNILIISNLKVLKSIQVYTIFHIYKLTYTLFIFIIKHKLNPTCISCLIPLIKSLSSFVRLSFSQPSSLCHSLISFSRSSLSLPEYFKRSNHEIQVGFNVFHSYEKDIFSFIYMKYSINLKMQKTE